MINFHCPTNIEKPRNTQGRTILPDIWGIDHGEKLTVKFNSLNQCVDDGELEYFCGTMARKKELTPLEFSDWRKVSATTKDKIWDVIKVIFF